MYEIFYYKNNTLELYKVEDFQLIIECIDYIIMMCVKIFNFQLC